MKNLNTIYGLAINSQGYIMTVTGAHLVKNKVWLEGYESEIDFNRVTMQESVTIIPVCQVYSDVESCDFEVKNLVLETTTINDRELTDVIPVFFDNSGYSRYYSLLTVGDYLEEMDNYTSEPVYIATREEIERSIKTCSYDLNYDQYLEQKEHLTNILDVIDGDKPDVEYDISLKYIQSVWYQLDPQDYYSTAGSVTSWWLSDEDYLPF